MKFSLLSTALLAFRKGAKAIETNSGVRGGGLGEKLTLAEAVETAGGGDLWIDPGILERCINCQPDERGKVAICHKGRTIKIDSEGLEEHCAIHGDSCGSCGEKGSKHHHVSAPSAAASTNGKGNKSEPWHNLIFPQNDSQRDKNAPIGTTVIEANEKKTFDAENAIAKVSVSRSLLPVQTKGNPNFENESVTISNIVSARKLKEKSAKKGNTSGNAPDESEEKASQKKATKKNATKKATKKKATTSQSTIPPKAQTLGPTKPVKIPTPSQATPSTTPSIAPTTTPLIAPTTTPNSSPTTTPNSSPTTAPNSTPTSTPNSSPTTAPNSAPTTTSSSTPTSTPNSSPTTAPNSAPTTTSSSTPTTTPNSSPTTTPSSTPGTAPAQFDITLVHMGVTTPDEKFVAAFVEAKARWETIIIGDLPDQGSSTTDWFAGQFSPRSYTDPIDDIAIGYSIDPIDGEGETLGFASCRMGLGNRCLAGIMVFDKEDFDVTPIEDIKAIILHEMGHVLGLVGTLGPCLGNCDNIVPNQYIYGSEAPNECLLAVAEFNKLVGTGTSSLLLENDGEAGNVCGHWEEDTFRTDTNSELMTALFEENLLQPISRVTVGALDDLGVYTLNYDAADPWPMTEALPGSVGLPVTQARPGSWEVTRTVTSFNLAEMMGELPPPVDIGSDQNTIPLRS